MGNNETKSENWYNRRGWHFDEHDDFVDKDGNTFNFHESQEHYEYVHGRIKHIIYDRLYREFGLQQYPIPSRSTGTRTDLRDAPRLFVTPDVLLNPNLLIIVQGTGLVPPGQWARKLFTNGKRGEIGYASQFPYLQRARHLGWAVVLCDPNHPESGRDHVFRVWEDIVRRSEAWNVMMVSFSAGTFSTIALFEHITEEFMARVQAVVLMDGCTHTKSVTRQAANWLQEHSWVFVARPLSRWSPPNIEQAPTGEHDRVPGAVVGQVFEYLMERQAFFAASLTEDKFKEYLKGYTWA